jgi:hypothetical protein
MLTDVAILETVLEQHRLALGPDFHGYRNHAYRVLNLCRRLASPSVDVEKIAVATAFHDLGIWSDRTFDYLTPSANLAAAYLYQIGRAAWTPEITVAILHHHKISPSVVVPRRIGHLGPDGNTGDSLVEPFRRADWIDVSRGIVSFGVPRQFVRQLQERWPDAGFHWRLVQLSLRRFREHPLNPLPMLRL